MKRSRRAVFGALVGVSLIAAACGGDDGGTSGGTETATAETVDQGVQQGVKDALGATTTAAGGAATTAPGATAPASAKQPTTLEGWEALWKTERDAIVKKIKAGKTSKPIKIIPQGQGAGPGVKRVVTLVLAPNDGYTVGTTGKVKVKIIGQ